MRHPLLPLLILMLAGCDSAARPSIGVVVSGSSAEAAVLTYDATRLIDTDINAGARTREEVRRYMESLRRERPPYAGLGGPVAFDSADNLLREYALAVVTPRGVRGLTGPG